MTGLVIPVQILIPRMSIAREEKLSRDGPYRTSPPNPHIEQGLFGVCPLPCLHSCVCGCSKDIRDLALVVGVELCLGNTEATERVIAVW